MTAPYYADDTVRLFAGDCLDVMRTLADCSVDAVVTDPPYGLEFMGKDWDAPWKAEGARWREASRLPGSHSTNPTPRPQGFGVAGRPFQAWCELWATECLRVLKPGGHMLAFGGTRTSHRLACAIEDAGFEIRDSIAWLYGSGFPKSLDVSKAIDRARGEDRVPVDAVRSWLNERRIAAGFSHDAVNKHFGHASNGGGSSSAWMTNPTSKSLPTWEQWIELKRIFGFDGEMDAEVWRLNGRKGKPGDNFEARELLSSRQVADIRNGHGREYGGAMFAGEETGKIEHHVTAPATDDARTWQGWGTALKPAHEPVICARKPFNAVPLEWRLVADVHHALAGLLWLLLSPAKRAETTSQSNPAAPVVGMCVSAHVAAALNTSPEPYAKTDTFNSPATAATSSSIVSSWSSILAALSDPTRTSTTSTRSSMTTGLRILSSLLAPVTSQTTMPACDCLTAGPSAPATSAASSSSDEWPSWLHSLTTSAPANVGESTAPAVASALASIAEELSRDQAAANTAPPSASTRVAASSSPAHEPIVVARKPLSGTVAANVLRHGTGALNVGGCRVGGESTIRTQHGTTKAWEGGAFSGSRENGSESGRWPANVVLDESQADALDAMSGETTSGNRKAGTYGLMGYMGADEAPMPAVNGDSGGASRFFYTAKASAEERIRLPKAGAGNDRVLDDRGMATVAQCQTCGTKLPNAACTHDNAVRVRLPPRADAISHPTVKPLSLMRWLVRLVTPPGGTVLEPFAGSGTTVEAAILEGFACIAIEREPDYLPLIVQRINRRRDPVAAVKATGDDGGLFDLLDFGVTA